MKVIFYTDQIDVRGTCVALYDYAYYNETILQNESVVITRKTSQHNSLAIKKFLNRFRVIFYDSFQELSQIVKDFDVLYCILYGKKNNEIASLTNIKIVIHCVFDLSEPFGNVYCAVSKSLAKKYKSDIYVPHMIGLKPSITRENRRKEFGIPKNALVFGRYGGQDTFDLKFAIEAIREIVRSNSNIYFVFMNTPIFDNHEQIKFTDPVVDSEEKNRFICTCDAYLECGTLGHSFGLSIGEFSVNNKPIIAYKPNSFIWNTSHLDILGESGFYYSNKDEFINTLLNFKKLSFKADSTVNWNRYSEYSPIKVMKIFQEVFL